MKSINTIKALCPNAVITNHKGTNNQWIVNGRWVGCYQNWEVTPGDVNGTGSNRKILYTEQEVVAYVLEGTLPAGFEGRSVISRTMGKDDAKSELKAYKGARELLEGIRSGSVVAPAQVVAEQPKATETAPAAVSKPAIDMTALLTAAIAAGKPQAEILELIAALK